jgi:hypothetical protein
MHDIETLITRSIDTYQAILHEIKKMSTCLEKDRADSITEGCSRLIELQELARKTDEGLMGELDNRHMQDEIMTILKKRQQLIEEIVKQNELLFSKITGKIELINEELMHVRGGITAMAGYRSASGKTGKIVNRAF